MDGMEGDVIHPWKGHGHKRRGLKIKIKEHPKEGDGTELCVCVVGFTLFKMAGRASVIVRVISGARVLYSNGYSFTHTVLTG